MRLLITLILFFGLSLDGFGQAIHYNIKKIEFHTSPGDWEGCEFGFVIYPNRTVEYKADSTYCKPILGKKQTISQERYDSLMQMLDDNKFPEYKNRYGYGVDCGISTLTINYNKGKTKKVTIICGDEPEDLKKILLLLYRLKETEHWK